MHVAVELNHLNLKDKATLNDSASIIRSSRIRNFGENFMEIG